MYNKGLYGMIFVLCNQPSSNNNAKNYETKAHILL